jgi:hypothetical protein
MIDALESPNLTQRSQSNAKEMSWDERECFGSAQCAHKYVKYPRVRAKSRPTHIYRRTPSKRAVELRGRQTRLSHHRQTQCPRLLHTIAPRVHELRNPTIMNSRYRRVLWFWPQRWSRRSTHSSKLHFTKIDRQTRLVLSTTASVATSAASRSEGGPTDTSVSSRGRVCRPPWPRLSPPWPHLSQRPSQTIRH